LVDDALQIPLQKNEIGYVNVVGVRVGNDRSQDGHVNLHITRRDAKHLKSILVCAETGMTMLITLVFSLTKTKLEEIHVSLSVKTI